MKKFSSALIFTLLVSLAMVMLDAFYHLFSNTAVHVNYMAVKFSIIFLVLFLTTFWLGKGLHQSLFALISGPVIFYCYYLFADPTLNRALFKLDEGFGYVFLHIGVFALSYYLFYALLAKKQSFLALTLSKAFLFSLIITALDAFYQLMYTQLTSHNEESTAQLLHADTTLYFFLFLFLVSFLSFFYLKNKVQYMLPPLITLFFTHFIGQNIVRTMFSLLIVLISLWLFSLSETISLKDKPSGKNKTSFLTFFILSALIGIFYHFIPYKIIKALHLGLSMPHNYHIMIGSLALVIALCSLAKLLVLSKK